MSFMKQQVTRKMQWVQIDGNQGTTFVPAEAVADSGLAVNESTDEESILEKYEDYYEGSEIYTIGLIEGYGARLRASGYMDCTDWCVFESAQEAQEYLDENYPEDDETV